MDDKVISLFILNCFMNLSVDTFVQLVFDYIDYNNLSSEDLDAAVILFAEKYDLRKEVIDTIINKMNNNNN